MPHAQIPAGQYLLDNWHKGTFPNLTQSVSYHWKKHGKGRSPQEYTRDAMEFYGAQKHLGQRVTLADGSEGIKILIKKTVDGKVIRQGGYWTLSGRVVTYWD